MKKLMIALATLVGVAGLIALIAYKPKTDAPLAQASPRPTAAGATLGADVASPAADTPLATGTFAGDEISTVYGPVQVNAIVTDGKITSIQWVKQPNDRDRSIQISAQAGPKLVTEALAAQSSKVDVVSGATQTSEGFAQSLASAIVKAHG